MTALAALIGPQDVDWAAAARVSLVGFAGVFVVLALLYLSTLTYGALVRRLTESSKAKQAKAS